MADRRPLEQAAATRIRHCCSQAEKMRTSTNRVVVGLDNGGKVNNATVLETSGRFLVDGLVRIPQPRSGGSGYCD